MGFIQKYKMTASPIIFERDFHHRHRRLNFHSLLLSYFQSLVQSTLFIMPSLKSLCLTTAAALIPFSAALDETTYPYQAPTDTDVRAPCPALNALANHGLLPRDGKGITIEVLSDAAYKGFSIASDATQVFGSLAFQTSTTGNASTFNLDDLKQHSPHVLEHDGSMSRNDSYWGDNLSFNEQAWARTLANWGDNEVITVSQVIPQEHWSLC